MMKSSIICLFDSKKEKEKKQFFAYRPAFVTIISVPSSLNSSQSGFISKVAVTLANFECSPLFWSTGSGICLVDLLDMVCVPTVSKQAAT